MIERTDFEVGESATLERTIDDAMIRGFAEVTGDRNPVHLDDDYAKESFFGGRIAHGMLVASLISEVLGTRLPGPGTIYLSQQLAFRAPVRPGDTVTVRAEIIAFDKERSRITMSTRVTNQRGEIVIDGEAKLVMAAALRKRG
jgi:3-hydroxybutyryl-CoA dehydratase